MDWDAPKVFPEQAVELPISGDRYFENILTLVRFCSHCIFPTSILGKEISFCY